MTQHRRSTPRPPQIPGLPHPRAVDVLRLTWWSAIAWAYGVVRGPARLYNLALVVLWGALLPVVLVTRVIATLLPTARYYMTPTRDAVIAVRAARDGWHIEDHMSARPGHGLGRPLRAALLPDLLDAADLLGVPIHVGAATAALAGTYRRELPGLVDVGPSRPRGRRLVREPRPASDAVAPTA